MLASTKKSAGHPNRIGAPSADPIIPCSGRAVDAVSGQHPVGRQGGSGGGGGGGVGHEDKTNEWHAWMSHARGLGAADIKHYRRHM